MASSRDLDQQDSLRLCPADSQDSSPLLCSNNCGFFGSPLTNNLCSACCNQSHPSSDALPSAVPAHPREISLFDQFPPASTIVNLPPSGIQASPIADTPVLPSRRRWVFSLPPEDLSNGRVVFGGGGSGGLNSSLSNSRVVFGGGAGSGGQSPSFSNGGIVFGGGGSSGGQSPSFSNGGIVFGGGGSSGGQSPSFSNGGIVFGGGGSGGQSPSPWMFSKEPIFFTSFGRGNVLPPSFTDPQGLQSPGSSPHPSSLPVPEPSLSARASSVSVPEPSVSPQETSLTVSEPSPAPRASSLPVPEPSVGGSDVKGSSSDRCHSCRKRLRLGLTFKCRCGDVFCSSHRFPDQHECKLDIKAKEREAIAKGNPVIKPDKLQGRI